MATVIELKIENRDFKNKSGDLINYSVYFVELENGLKVYVKPVDNTGKALLDLLLKEKNKKEDNEWTLLQLFKRF